MNPPTNNFAFKNEEKSLSTPECSQTESELSKLLSMPSCIHLGLETLKSFEVIEHQFQNWGVTFFNAMIIEPSNPAFAVPQGIKVLMGAPRSGLIEINFTRPANFVSGFIRSSRRTILSAYNQREELLARDEMPTSNLICSDSIITPHVRLTVNAKNIYKVIFYSFDAQLIIVDLNLSF